MVTLTFDLMTSKYIRFFPFHRGIMWPSLVKIRYTELKLLCGNLCGRPPAIPNHIIRAVSRRAYKNPRNTTWSSCHNQLKENNYIEINVVFFVQRKPGIHLLTMASTTTPKTLPEALVTINSKKITTKCTSKLMRFYCSKKTWHTFVNHGQNQYIWHYSYQLLTTYQVGWVFHEKQLYTEEYTHFYLSSLS